MRPKEEKWNGQKEVFRTPEKRGGSL